MTDTSNSFDPTARETSDTGAAPDQPTASAPEEPTVSDPTVSDPTVSDPTVSDPTVSDPTAAAEKDPDEWVTGDEPMTGAQASYLGTLAQDTGRSVPDHLTKAEASKLIDELQAASGRASS